MNDAEARPVLVTGCSSGIGQCLASRLHERGYRVFATARDPADLERLGTVGVESLPLDLRDSGSIRRAVDHVLARTGGRLHALVNNAGYGQPGAVEDLDRAALREQFEVNVFGTQELTNLVIPAMRRAGRGRVVHVSSILGRIAQPYKGAYCASKFALEALADAQRIELRGSGLFVCLVEPGPIQTRFSERALRAFRENVSGAGSLHAAYYGRMESKALEGGRLARFAKSPDLVAERVLHALESDRPRERYLVTLPARAFAVLRRVLSDRMLDRLLAAAAKR